MSRLYWKYQGFPFNLAVQLNLANPSLRLDLNLAQCSEP